jgi:hypothetical protein
MFSSFSKIGQFRNVVKVVKDQCEHHFKPLPVLEFKGTVKLHGTNAAVGLSKDGKFWTQSRSSIITPMKDNAGFSNYAYKHKAEFISILSKHLGDNDRVIMYGEWCGEGIQKGVGICEVSKRFVVFALKGLSADEDSDKGTWLPMVISLDMPLINLYFINNFQQYSIKIDFNYPEASTEELIALTIKVEDECPVSKRFGVEGIGEGIVWSCGDYRFKVKGEKHANSKVSTLKPKVAIAPEVLKARKDFLEYAVTEARLNQGLENVELVDKSIGKFIGWISKDVWAEEKDVLEASGLTMKDVSGLIIKKSRSWFIDKLNAL